MRRSSPTHPTRGMGHWRRYPKPRSSRVQRPANAGLARSAPPGPCNRAGREEGADGRGGLEPPVVEPDGRLTRMGWTNLCLASTMSLYDFVSPLVTVRGFLFASLFTNVPTVPTVCSYQGLRLKPLYALDLKASAAEAFVPSSEAEPALLAMNVTISNGGVTREELRVFSMNADGDLR